MSAKENDVRYFRRVIRIKATDSPNVRLGLAQDRAGLTVTDEILVPGVLTYAEYRKRRATWDRVRQCIGLDGEFWKGIRLRQVENGAWPGQVAAVVLPAIIEHQPRALLRAMAMGLPVIATEACGLGGMPGVTTVPAYDASALRNALNTAIARNSQPERAAA